MIRVVSAAFALLMAVPVLAQANETGVAQPTAPSQVAPNQPYATPPAAPGYAPQQQPQPAYPPQQQAYPPQQQGYAPQQQQGYSPPPQGYAPPPQGYAPAQPQATQPPRYPEAQSVSPAPAGTGSQQVVVTPPPQPATPPPAPAPAPTVNVNPPASSSGAYAQGNQPLVVQREAGRGTLETVVIDAGYGALAGALVGAGISLIDQGNNLGRNLTLGAGAGILVGAAVGAIQAYNQGDRVASDGLGSPARDRLASVGERRSVVAFGGRF